MSTKFKKVESYYDVYLRDDGFLLKFNQPKKYLDDLLMFSGFTPKNIEDSYTITIQHTDSGWCINGWLYWGSRTVLTSDSAWKWRDSIVGILKKRANLICIKLPREYESSFDMMIHSVATLAKLQSNAVDRKVKGIRQYVFDIRTNKGE